MASPWPSNIPVLYCILHKIIHLYSLGPFYVENQMVVAKAGHPGDGTGRVLPTMVVDEGEALRTGRKRVKYMYHNIHFREFE